MKRFATKDLASTQVPINIVRNALKESIESAHILLRSFSFSFCFKTFYYFFRNNSLLLSFGRHAIPLKQPLEIQFHLLQISVNSNVNWTHIIDTDSYYQANYETMCLVFSPKKISIMKFDNSGTTTDTSVENWSNDVNHSTERYSKRVGALHDRERENGTAIKQSVTVLTDCFA